MPTFALLSAKGSPGVTTTATALAAVATRSSRPLLVELDPSGGSVHALTARSVALGLVDVAGRLRLVDSLAGGRAAIAECTTLEPDGVPALVAPTAGPVAESVIESALDRWLPAVRGSALDVLVDAGRWEPTQRTARRIVGADLLGVVCRPTVAGVESARHLLERLWEVARCPAAAIVVGSQPYRPDEVAAILDLPLAGSVVWDPRGVAHLWARGVAGRWSTTRLARSAADTLAGLGQVVASLPPRALPEPGAP
jgi:Flp pilus assembly CpaE family ATPase